MLERHVESRSSINTQVACNQMLVPLPSSGVEKAECPHAPTFTLTSKYHSAKIISYFGTTPTAPVHLHLHMTRDSYERHVSRVKYASEHVSNIHFYEPPPKSHPPHNSSPSFSAAGCSTASGKLVGCSSCSQPQQRKTINPTFNLYFLLSLSSITPLHSLCFSHISFPPFLSPSKEILDTCSFPNLLFFLSFFPHLWQRLLCVIVVEGIWGHFIQSAPPASQKCQHPFYFTTLIDSAESSIPNS